MSAPTPQNLLANLPASLPQEVTEILAQNAQVRIERILSSGHSSPPDFWYDQDEHERVLLLQGQAELQFDNQSPLVHLRAGDHLLIPAHTKHRVHWTTPSQPTIWLAVFFVDKAVSGSLSNFTENA